MRNDDDRKRLQDVEAILTSAYAPGVTLRDFTSNPRFSDHFMGVNLPLLNNMVPVRPGGEWARTSVVKRPAGREAPLFEISLRAYVDTFPLDGPDRHERNRNITLYKAMFLHEAAHILEGSFEPLHMGRLFDGFGNHGLAARLFGDCIEDYRVTSTVTDRFSHRSDFSRCLDFYHLMGIGVTGRYCGRFLPDFVCALERRVKCGAGLAALIGRHPRTRMGRNGRYRSRESLQADEERFLSLPLAPLLRARGYRCCGELVEGMTARIHHLKGKTVVDSARLLMHLGEILSIQCPEEVSRYDARKAFPEHRKGSPAPPGRPAHDFLQGSLAPASLSELDRMEKEILDRISAISARLGTGRAVRVAPGAPGGADSVLEVFRERDHRGKRRRFGPGHTPPAGTGGREAHRPHSRRLPGAHRRYHRTVQEPEAQPTPGAAHAEHPGILQPRGGRLREHRHKLRPAAAVLRRIV